MEDWKNTKCGTCIIQRQKPICNSCLGHQFYKPMSNADKIRNMNDEELEKFIEKVSGTCIVDALGGKSDCNAECRVCKINFGSILDWLQSEVKGSE